MLRYPDGCACGRHVPCSHLLTDTASVLSNSFVEDDMTEANDEQEMRAELKEINEKLQRFGERLTNSETMLNFIGLAGRIDVSGYHPSHAQYAPSGRTLIQARRDWQPDHPYRR
jgi:uncharacterized membrane protein